MKRTSVVLLSGTKPNCIVSNLILFLISLDDTYPWCITKDVINSISIRVSTPTIMQIIIMRFSIGHSMIRFIADTNVKLNLGYDKK